MPRKLKGKLYKTVVLLALVYGSQCWARYKAHDDKMTATEMMLRMAHGVTKMDHIKSSYIRGSLFIEEPITAKIDDRQMDWYCHVLRRPIENPVRRAVMLDIPTNHPKKRGRPKHTWLDQMKKKQKQIGFSEEMIQDRTACKTTLRLYRRNGRRADTTSRALRSRKVV